MADDLHERIAVVGLGYVGLSLATAFGRTLPTTGFDLNPVRVRELESGCDRNGEVPSDALVGERLSFTDDPAALEHADIIVVAVPTPIDRAKRPDLSHLVDASRLVGRALAARAADDGPPVVVYESTVYPGCTEEVCVPVLEEASGLRVGDGFAVAYSPERINPGDVEHGLDAVQKIVAAQDPDTLERVANVYGVVVKAGVFRAADIRTAEAAKVIENIQRDLNIALMNELAMLFHRMGINTRDVLEAARTKWNFLPFEPGLVGGHCIPVDPYYLTHKAQEVGYHPEVILAGRRINDSLGDYVSHETVRLIIESGRAVQGSEALLLGAAFKENVRDVRNSRVFDVIAELERYGVRVSVHDPIIGTEALARMGVAAVEDPFAAPARYDALILAVPHAPLRARGLADYVALVKTDGGPGVLVDVKGALPEAASAPGILYWSL